MKRYVIGDVHGCHFELCELIARILMDCQGKDYKLIFVGDYVDRGPKSKEVVDLVRKLQSEGHIALMGNHEDMIVSGELMYAAETLRSYNTLQMPEDVLEWMRSLPKYYEDDTIIVAHAGVLPNTKMEDQSDIHLLWYRYQDYQNANLGKHFYHGHTPKLGKIENMKDRTNVDTACVYGGHLTAAIVGDDGKPEGFIQVPAQHSVYV
jgi:serine/threonine protein phosphatase 1